VSGARPDLHRVLFTLRRHGADVVVVGSAAAWIHGASRVPNDIDVVIRDGWDNFERLAEGLRELRASPHVDEFGWSEPPRFAWPVDAAVIARSAISCWRTEVGDVDLLDSVLAGPGSRDVDYDELARRSVTRSFGGLSTTIACLDDLIGAAVAADRVQDRAALGELRALAGVHRNRAEPRRRIEPRRGIGIDP
jgi:hypothetical protein